eukprot:gene7946-192_t
MPHLFVLDGDIESYFHRRFAEFEGIRGGHGIRVEDLVNLFLNIARSCGANPSLERVQTRVQLDLLVIAPWLRKATKSVVKDVVARTTDGEGRTSNYTLGQLGDTVFDRTILVQASMFRELLEDGRQCREFRTLVEDKLAAHMASRTSPQTMADYIARVAPDGPVAGPGDLATCYQRLGLLLGSSWPAAALKDLADAQHAHAHRFGLALQGAPAAPPTVHGAGDAFKLACAGGPLFHFEFGQGASPNPTRRDPANTRQLLLYGGCAVVQASRLVPHSGLYKMLSDMSMVRALDLSRTVVGIQHLLVFLGTLAAVSTLRSLTLARQAIEIGHLPDVLAKVRDLVTLTSLDLSYNPLSYFAGSKILALVRRCPSLCHVCVEGTEIKGKQAALIHEACVRNACFGNEPFEKSESVPLGVTGVPDALAHPDDSLLPELPVPWLPTVLDPAAISNGRIEQLKTKSEHKPRLWMYEYADAVTTLHRPALTPDAVATNTYAVKSLVAEFKASCASVCTELITCWNAGRQHLPEGMTPWPMAGGQPTVGLQQQVLVKDHIVFIVADDLCPGGAEWMSKLMKQEALSLAVVAGASSHFMLPLCCLVDYLGTRVMCITPLPCHLGHENDSVPTEWLHILCLHLYSSLWVEHPAVRSLGSQSGLKCHIAPHDGRPYVTSAFELLPLEPRESGTMTTWCTTNGTPLGPLRRIRPELAPRLPSPASSAGPSIPVLLAATLQEAAQAWKRLPHPFTTDIPIFLHSQGLGCHHLARLVQILLLNGCETDADPLVVELFARIARKMLGARLRHAAPLGRNLHNETQLPLYVQFIHGIAAATTDGNQMCDDANCFSQEHRKAHDETFAQLSRMCRVAYGITVTTLSRLQEDSSLLRRMIFRVCELTGIILSAEHESVGDLMPEAFQITRMTPVVKAIGVWQAPHQGWSTSLHTVDRASHLMFNRLLSCEENCLRLPNWNAWMVPLLEQLADFEAMQELSREGHGQSHLVLATNSWQRALLHAQEHSSFLLVLSLSRHVAWQRTHGFLKEAILSGVELVKLASASFPANSVGLANCLSQIGEMLVFVSENHSHALDSIEPEVWKTLATMFAGQGPSEDMLTSSSHCASLAAIALLKQVVYIQERLTGSSGLPLQPSWENLAVLQPLARAQAGAGMITASGTSLKSALDVATQLLPPGDPRACSVLEDLVQYQHMLADVYAQQPFQVGMLLISLNSPRSDNGPNTLEPLAALKIMHCAVVEMEKELLLDSDASDVAVEQRKMLHDLLNVGKANIGLWIRYAEMEEQANGSSLHLSKIYADVGDAYALAHDAAAAAQWYARCITNLESYPQQDLAEHHVRQLIETTERKLDKVVQNQGTC